jgi:hypothetical protein
VSVSLDEPDVFGSDVFDEPDVFGSDVFGVEKFKRWRAG